MQGGPKLLERLRWDIFFSKGSTCTPLSFSGGNMFSFCTSLVTASKLCDLISLEIRSEISGLSELRMADIEAELATSCESSLEHNSSCCSDFLCELYGREDCCSRGGDAVNEDTIWGELILSVTGLGEGGLLRRLLGPEVFLAELFRRPFREFLLILFVRDFSCDSHQIYI